MIENQGDFAERFEKLRGKQTYQELSDAIFQRFNVRITPQAMNKWAKQSGGITPDNARIIAEYFDVTPGWLLFGESAAAKIEDLVRDLPGDGAQQALDFLEYKTERASEFMAAEKLARYMSMIERIRADLHKRKNSDG